MSAVKQLIKSLKEELRGVSKDISPTYIKLIEIFPLQPIVSKRQHEAALTVAEKLISYSNNRTDADNGADLYLKTLSELVEDYERKNYKSSTLSGAEMLSYIMELKQLKQSDLSKELGGQSVVSKILNGERELNLRQVRALAKRFNLSPSVFV